MSTKTVTWILVTALISCLLFPPLFIAWIIALCLWGVAAAGKGHASGQMAKSSAAHRPQRAPQPEAVTFSRAGLTSSDQIDLALGEAEAHLGGFSKLQQAYIDMFLRSRQIMDESFEIAEKTKDDVTRAMRLETVRQQIERLEELSVDDRCVLALSDTKELWTKYFRLQDNSGQIDEVLPVDLNAFIGRPWGEIVSELTGGANLVDGKQTWELADEHKHDLPKMLACCSAELKTMEQAGQIPAPFYFERAAILLRKAKQYQSEVQLIELYLSAVEAWNLSHHNSRPNGGGARHEKIAQRFAKAKELAAKHGNLSQLE